MLRKEILIFYTRFLTKSKSVNYILNWKNVIFMQKKIRFFDGIIILYKIYIENKQIKAIWDLLKL